MTTAIDAIRVYGHGMIIDLDGWEDYSVWGWSGGDQGALFAELWRNTDDPDAEPTVIVRRSFSPYVMAEYIAGQTGRSEGEVRQAMAFSAPASVKLRLLGQAAA